MALKGVKVIEIAGLAPAPFCGMILADFGATVLRIDKIGYDSEMDCLGHGKKSLAVNLKHKEGVEIVQRLCKTSDVLIEPFRHGVMERLNLGPNVLLKQNSKLIYARLTGYGQKGVYSKRAGHDINYSAVSGLLSLFGRHKEKPLFPVNLTADFGGGGLTCALGIILALYERHTSGQGQIIDCSMVRGAAYLGSWLYRSQNKPLVWGKERGQNLLDTGAHFYEVYETKDGRYMSVGALEPQFYSNLLAGLGLTIEEVPQFEDFEKGKKLFASIFIKKTLKEWCDVFDSVDACVAPVLSVDEAPEHSHNVAENTFVKNEDGDYVPTPQPVLSRTPGTSKGVEKELRKGEHTRIILQQLGYSEERINQLENDGAIETYKASKL